MNSGQKQTKLNENENYSLLTVQKSIKNPFKSGKIVPSIRIHEMNPYCFVLYSTAEKGPLAIYEQLDKSMVEKQIPREGKIFYQNENINEKDKKFYADNSHYEETQVFQYLKLQKGHLAPSADFQGNELMFNSTFSYINCCPQYECFNCGTWKHLQIYCRNLLRFNKCETIEIASGPIHHQSVPLDKDKNLYKTKETIILKEDGVVVPLKYYKIIKATTKFHSYLGAFVFDNSNQIDQESTFYDYWEQLSKLEMQTGLLFNFGQCRKLWELDEHGLLIKTMKQYSEQLIASFFNRAQTLRKKNHIRIQSFVHKVPLQREFILSQPIKKLAEKQYENLLKKYLTQNFFSPYERILQLMELHRDAYQLFGLTDELSKKIQERIIEIMVAMKGKNILSREKLIYKLNKNINNNYYQYPFQKELLVILSAPLQNIQINSDNGTSQRSQQF